MARRKCWMEVAGGSDVRGGAATLSRACPAESDIQGAKRNRKATTAMLYDVVDMYAVKKRERHRGGRRNSKT